MNNMETELDNQLKNLSTNSELDYSKIKSSINNIIKNEGYVKYSVDKEVYTPDGGSFLGILCAINIKGKTDDEEKETNLFLKIMTPGDQATFISLPDVYKRELYVYNELSKIYNELQNEANISEQDKFKFVKSYDESIPNAIILQNMKKEGYKTGFRMDVLSLEYAEMAVKKLAKFHALSFVLEEKRPEYFERNIKMLNQPFTFDKDWDGFIQNVSEVALKYLDGDRNKKFKDVIPGFVAKFSSYLNTKCGRDVLCHGDYRVNNILAKEENGVLKDLIPIDYQLVYLGCPVLDFLYFIYPSTDKEFRKSHLPHLKELYYEELTRFLKQFELDAATIYPKEEFEAHYQERLDYGLMMCVNLLPFLMLNDEVIPDVTAEPLAGINFNLHEEYKVRIVDVVDEFIELGRL